jgi:hypothetical protein
VPLGSTLVHGRDGPRPVTTMITRIWESCTVHLSGR